ncbi:hypothetical protein BJ968_004499 [Kineococcus aurantiacus]|uniref:Uncharacterized protein n=1 Tax=Kineococcus aurantiacus TaxID=37633 RepID=A0A7Y9DQQ7_9ACTN|nr:hypothetical protein [Kineococcus aurantiacus]
MLTCRTISIAPSDEIVLAVAGPDTRGVLLR